MTRTAGVGLDALLARTMGAAAPAAVPAPAAPARPKRGRPPLAPGLRRERRYSVNLPPRIASDLAAAATARGLSVSAALTVAACQWLANLTGPEDM